MTLTLDGLLPIIRVNQELNLTGDKMIKKITAIWLLAVLAACGDGQPLYEDENAIETVEEELPPGTEDPEASQSIFRYEERNEIGGGLVTDVSYDETADTFTVDNLGFDGANVYQRGVAVATLGGYDVFDADDVTPDFLTDAPIEQIVPYRAINGRSTVLVGDADALPEDLLPRTTFSIVRTGGYAGYGFGGFVYERNGGVTLGGTGQAKWEGRYAGIRTFTGGGGVPILNGDGLELTEGDVYMAIDFEDFNANDAVQGLIYNRVRYDVDGNLLPELSSVDGFPVHPAIPFVIVEGVETVLETGEFAGELSNLRFDPFSGDIITYEEGTYSGIIAGDITTDDGGEVVGVFVVESWSPFSEDVTVQETGGFIIDRAAP